MSNTDTIFQGVKCEASNTWTYEKCGTVVKEGKTFTAYTLGDIEVYSGPSFLDACAILRGETPRSEMK